MKRPLNVVLAAAAAIIGGLVSIAFLATALMSSDLASLSLTHAGFALLFAVLFFGFAGQLFPNGTVNYAAVIALGLLTIIAVAVGIVVEPKGVNLNYGIALFIIAVIQIILILPARAEKWVSLDRA